MGIFWLFDIFWHWKADRLLKLITSYGNNLKYYLHISRPSALYLYTAGTVTSFIRWENDVGTKNRHHNPCLLYCTLCASVNTDNSSILMLLSIYMLSQKAGASLQGSAGLPGLPCVIAVTTVDCIHRLNMELDLQSLFGLYVHSCTHWLRPRNCLPPPRIWAHIRGRYWSAKIDDISL